MKSWRIIGSLGALALAAGVASAAAAGDMCAALQTRLAVLDRATAGPGDPGIDGNILRQRQELDRATLLARRSNCIVGLFSQTHSASPKCGSLLALIDRMKVNLDRLTTERQQASPDPFVSGRQRVALLRQLAMNQCGSQFADYGFAAPARRGLFASLFGTPPPIRSGFGASGFYYYPDQSVFGTYRTLCVRTCDGYYFPISFSTVPSKFSADEQTCQALCPGTPVALYTHRNPGEESAAMVSLAGEPYTALPAAFRYRQQFDAACTCRSATAAVSAALLPAPAASPANVWADVAVSYPAPRPVREDPETESNRSGGFVPRPVGDRFRGSIAGDPIGKAVRVVGPSYYIAE